MHPVQVVHVFQAVVLVLMLAEVLRLVLVVMARSRIMRRISADVSPMFFVRKGEDAQVYFRGEL